MNGDKPNKWRDTIDTGLALLILYFSINPEAMDSMARWARDEWKRTKHNISVGQAIRAIRRLPETEAETDTDE